MINNIKLNIFAYVLKWVWKGWDIDLDIKVKDDNKEDVESIKIFIKWPEDKK